MDVGLVLVVGFALNVIFMTVLTVIGWFPVFRWQAKWMDAANKARDDEARAAADVRCGEIYRSEIHRRAMGRPALEPDPSPWRTDAPPVGVPIIVDHPAGGIAVRTLYSSDVMLTVTRWMEVPK